MILGIVVVMPSGNKIIVGMNDSMPSSVHDVVSHDWDAFLCIFLFHLEFWDVE